MTKKNFCGQMFPGVEYKPFKREELKNFVLDIQRLGFTQWRKIRLLQAVGRFCCAAAVPYVQAYNAPWGDFTGAAWEAIHQTIYHFSEDMEGGFLTLLGFWLKFEFNHVIYKNYIPKRYSGDKAAPEKIESIYKPLNDEPGTNFLLIDTLKDNSTENLQDRAHDRVILDKLIKDAHLSEKEKQVLGGFFGLDEVDSMNLREMAARLNCSRENIRQIKIRALNRIRENIKKDGIKCYR